jgi:hypothetical protein
MQVGDGQQGWQASRSHYGKDFVFWLGGWESSLIVRCRKTVRNQKQKDMIKCTNN